MNAMTVEVRSAAPELQFLSSRLLRIRGQASRVSVRPRRERKVPVRCAWSANPALNAACETFEYEAFEVSKEVDSRLRAVAVAIRC